MDDKRESFAEMNDTVKFDRDDDHGPTTFTETRNFFNNDKIEKSTISRDNNIEKTDVKTRIAEINGRSVPSYVKSFELGKVKWRGPLASNYLNKSQNIFKQIDDYSNGHSLSTNESTEPFPKSFETIEPTANFPHKMAMDEKNSKNKNNEIFVSNSNEMSKSSINSMTSLSAVIEDLDAQIKALEIAQPKIVKTKAIVEPNKNIYPIIDDVKFESTGWTIRKKQNLREQTYEITKNDRTIDDNDDDRENSISIDFSNGERGETFVNENSNATYHETPKKSLRKMPIMESTRKSGHSDSTRTKFPTPARTETTISTITVPPTPVTPDNDREIPTKSTIDEPPDRSVPFEVERFLHDALGDELYNTSVTYDFSGSGDRSNSQFNASELLSEARTPWQRKIDHGSRLPATEPSIRSTDTLNRSFGIYRSLSQRIRKKFRGAAKTKPEDSPPSPPKICKTDDNSNVIGHLLQEVSVQQTLMNQASKALNVCHTMKEFAESSERVESDRLLLIASLRRSSALEEIKRISSRDGKMEKKFYGEKGEITIKNVCLNLRECFKFEPQDGETIEWFVVVVSQGLKVWATRAMCCPVNKLRIDFDEIIIMPNLMPNFKIVVQIYSLKLRRATYNHEDKYRIRREKRSTSCPPFFPSSPKFLKKNDCTLSPKLRRSNASKTGCTCFVLAGFVEFYLHDLSLVSPWPLMLVAENSILDRTIDLSLSCRLHLSVSHEGFLNHGDEAGGFASWNRRWCVLKGHTLLFWNYPREQETKEPLTVIELINCVSDKITTARRTICAKARTLLIETVRRRNASDTDSIIYECRSSCTIVRNFLSYDSLHELVEWSTKLNHVVMALREWNVIGKGRRAEISDS